MPVSQGHQICLALNSGSCIILSQPFRRWFISSGRCNKSVFPASSGPRFLMLLSWAGSGSPPAFFGAGSAPSSSVKAKHSLCSFQSDPPWDLLQQHFTLTLINHNILFNILFPVQHIVHIHHGSNQYRPFYCKPVSWCSSLGH